MRKSKIVRKTSPFKSRLGRPMLTTAKNALRRIASIFFAFTRRMDLGQGKKRQRKSFKTLYINIDLFCSAIQCTLPTHVSPKAGVHKWHLDVNTFSNREKNNILKSFTRKKCLGIHTDVDRTAKAAKIIPGSHCILISSQQTHCIEHRHNTKNQDNPKMYLGRHPRCTTT